MAGQHEICFDAWGCNIYTGDSPTLGSIYPDEKPCDLGLLEETVLRSAKRL